jgi:penicillin-binding protein 1A
VVDQGTGTAIRTRYGIQADVAGKTGTTQDNSDGWFILMHPQLVAGAWVGFNDNRVTMADSWGQGARSALPMVGDFFQQSLRARWIDSRVEFQIPRPRYLPPPPPDRPHPMRPQDALGGIINNLFGRLFRQFQ